MTVEQNTPEFSRPVAIDTVVETAAFSIEASAEEREFLARRLGILAVDRLTAELKLTRQIGAIVHLGGRFEAEVIQACVVTLAPIKARLAAAIDRRYGPAAALAETDAEEISLEDEELPDPMVDGVIDLGEAVSEQLALEIDPFPRVEGAEFAGYACGPEIPREAANPFSALESLFKKPK